MAAPSHSAMDHPGAVVPQGAAAVTERYHKVIRLLRQHPSAKYFREPVPWEKLGLTNYLDIIHHPMDLLTVSKKLERREYPTVAALRADVDLIWDNCITFNGENSWLKKYVDDMRTISSRKFNEADRTPLGLVRKPSTSAFGRSSGTSAGRGVGNVPLKDGSSRFITPQMRLGLLDNAVKLRDAERAELGRLAKEVCPTAVEECATDGRELKIDIDQLDPRSFVVLDMHVRKRLAAAVADTGGRIHAGGA